MILQSPKFFIFLILFLSLFSHQEAIFGENILIDFKPPKTEEKVSQKRQSGSGSRTNCSSALSDNSLSLLVPESETPHLTVSDSPALYIYIEKSVEQPLLVNLVIPLPGVENPIFERKIKANKAGIHKVVIPKTVKLKRDQLYLWQVGIPCQNNPEKISQVLSAGIKKIELPLRQEKLLFKSDNVIQKISILAGAGIWYDAIDLVYESNIYTAMEILESTNLVVFN